MSDVIRVLQVFTRLGRGGAESMIINYYRNIDRNKIQFDFLVHREREDEIENTFETEILEMGGQIHRLPPMTKPRRYRPALERFFKDKPGYSIVHTHVNAYGHLVLSVAKKYGVPVRISHAHTSHDPIVTSLFRGQFSITEIMKEILQSYLKRRIRKSANCHLACGIKAGDWMYGKNKEFTVVNNAIEVSGFRFDREKSQAFREELGITDKFVVGHVGSFREVKNHLFLVEVFSDFLKLYPESVLVLAGEGPLRVKVEDKISSLGIEEKVKFLGVRSDIPYVLQGLDLFLFPSIKEGLPVTLIEAQASGLLCIVSDIVTREIDITDLVHFVSLKKSSSAWAKYMMTALPYERRDRSLEIVKKGYDIQTNAIILQEYYLDQYATYVSGSSTES